MITMIQLIENENDLTYFFFLKKSIFSKFRDMII